MSTDPNSIGIKVVFVEDDPWEIPTTCNSNPFFVIPVANAEQKDSSILQLSSRAREDVAFMKQLHLDRAILQQIITENCRPPENLLIYLLYAGIIDELLKGTTLTFAQADALEPVVDRIVTMLSPAEQARFAAQAVLYKWDSTTDNPQLITKHCRTAVGHYCKKYLVSAARNIARYIGTDPIGDIAFAEPWQQGEVAIQLLEDKNDSTVKTLALARRAKLQAIFQREPMDLPDGQWIRQRGQREYLQAQNQLLETELAEAKSEAIGAASVPHIQCIIAVLRAIVQSNPITTILVKAAMRSVDKTTVNDPDLVDSVARALDAYCKNSPPTLVFIEEE